MIDIIKQGCFTIVNFYMIRALFRRQSASKLIVSQFGLSKCSDIKRTVYLYSQNQKESNTDEDLRKKWEQLDFYVDHNQSVEEIGRQLNESLNKMNSFFSNNLSSIDSMLKKTTLTAQNVGNELKVTIQQLNNFVQKTKSCQKAEEKERMTFLSQLKKFISNHPSNRSFFQTRSQKTLFILMVVTKLKTMLTIFKEYGSPSKLLENISPAHLNQIADKICLLEFKDKANFEKEYGIFQKIMYIIGGVIKQQSNSLPATPINIFWRFFKSIANIKQSTLSTLEMHLKGDTERLIKQINLTDQEYMKPFTEALLPPITTNQMIYVPLNDQTTTDSIFRYSENSIPVRVLYHSELAQLDGPNLQQNVMFHIHGGGFVAMSSHSTQCYTRVWASHSKMIIFSIDYSLAPKHPFPQAIGDLHRVYDFMLKRGCSMLKISPKNIYIGGDSAGGNLACSLTGVILKNKLPIPKGLFLVYPKLDARPNFYGSQKYLFTDPVLWPTFAKMAIDSYLSQKTQLSDPLASPLLLTEGYISGDQQDKRFPQKWPTTYIHVGSRDVLRDESFLFLQKMKGANIPCKCTVVSGLMHGYLLTQTIIPSSKGVVEHSAVMLSELVEATEPSKQ